MWYWQVKKTAMMTRVLQLIRELVIKGIHVTKRDLFYTDVKLFEKQVRTRAMQHAPMIRAMAAKAHHGMCDAKVHRADRQALDWLSRSSAAAVV